MRTMLGVLLAVLTAASASRGTVLTSAQCESDTMVIHVSIDYADALGVRWLNIQATLVGACEDPTMLLDTPVSVARTDAQQAFTIRAVPPLQNRVYIYRAWFTDQNGSHVVGGDNYCSAFETQASCGEGPISRGRFFGTPQQSIALYCEDQCWVTPPTQCLDFSQMESPWVNGELVDLICQPGRLSARPCDIPITPCLTVQRMVVVTDPGGCLVTPAESVTWGSLKSAYR